MDILAQSALLVAVTSIGLGSSILARNVKNKLYIAYALICALIFAWALCFFIDKVLWDEPGGAGVFYKLHLLFNVWLAPFALGFIRVMVRIQDRLSRRLLDLSVIVSLLLSVTLVFHFDQNPLVLQIIYFSPAIIVVQILQLMWIDRRLRLGIKLLPKIPTVGLMKRNLIYLGALLVMSTSVMDHVPFMGPVFPVIGNLGLCIYLFFVSQAITQQRLLNFSILISRFIVLMVLAFSLAGVYWLSVAWVEDNASLFFLNSFIASFLILMLLNPLRSLISYFTQRLLTKEHRRLAQTLQEAQRRLTGIVETSALFQTVLLTVEQTLEPQWASLYVLRSDGTKYRRVRLVGIDLENADKGQHPAIAVKELLSNHPLLRFCESLAARGELPILLDQMIENEIDRSASKIQKENLQSIVQGLKAIGCNLLIPLLDDGQILGFVAMYAPAPPDPWGSNWGLLTIIYPYFEQAAHTLRSMEIYVRQREKERLATLGEMAAGLAHEIRNPLGAIKGAAQFLDPSMDRPESRFLKVIVEEVDRLNRVVTQFLDYSKPQPAELKTVDIRQLTAKTIELLRPSLREGVDFEFDPGKRSAMVSAAPEQIQQVLINLIQNSYRALEGRPSGRVQVELDVEGSGQHQEVHVMVEDNGPGIKKEHLDKIFIPFFTTSPSGTGLGLSICQKIIEGHRGRIEVATEEGKYARFSIVLPVVMD